MPVHPGSNKEVDQGQLCSQVLSQPTTPCLPPNNGLLSPPSDVGLARSAADCAQAQAELATTHSEIEDLQVDVKLQAPAQALDSQLMGLTSSSVATSAAPAALPVPAAIPVPAAPIQIAPHSAVVQPSFPNRPATPPAQSNQAHRGNHRGTDHAYVPRGNYRGSKGWGGGKRSMLHKRAHSPSTEDEFNKRQRRDDPPYAESQAPRTKAPTI